MIYKETGVFATEDEAEQLDKLIDDANIPVIGFGPGPTAAETAHVEMRKGIHACALEHGLPEIPGYYGYNQETREFLVMDYEGGEPQ